MLDQLANNFVAFSIGVACLAVLWILASWIRRFDVRVAVRASAVFLAFPIAYFGHPFLGGSVWMLIAAIMASGSIILILVSLAIWAAVVLATIATCREFTGRNRSEP